MRYIFILADIAILAGIVTIVVKVAQHFSKSDSIEFVRVDERVPGTAERVFTYGLSFVGLMAVLYSLSGLIALAFVPVFPGARSLISHHDAEQRASLYIAALVVGAPVWLGLWRHAQRKLQTSPAELNTGERRLYFGAIFGTGAVASMFGLQEVVHSVLLFASSSPHNPLVRDTVVGGAQTVVYGAAWYAAARFGWKERRPEARDWAHDLALYVVAGTSVVLLFIGAQGVVHEAVQEIQGAGSKTLFDGTSTSAWRSWADGISWLLVGLLAFVPVQRYDLRRGGARQPRVLYEYAMLLWLVPVAVYATTDLLYEIIRRFFDYRPGHFNFLSDIVPLLVAAGTLAGYHWWLVRRETELRPESDEAISYPRRPAIAGFVAYGLAATAVGAAAILWVGVDWVANSHDVLSGSSWWRDQMSLGLALAIVGAGLWLPAWSSLQTAVRRDPRERDTPERRWLLSGITLVSALAATGFTVALLYVMLTSFLGAGSSSSLSDGLHFLSAALVSLALFAYHGVILRSEMRERGTKSPTIQSRIVALLAGDADPALQQIIAGMDVRVDVIGRLTNETADLDVPLSVLREQVGRLGTASHSTRALLILSANNGKLYPYGLRSEARPAEIAADMASGGPEKVVLHAPASH